jgi:hypothetical protein
MKKKDRARKSMKNLAEPVVEIRGLSYAAPLGEPNYGCPETVTRMPIVGIASHTWRIAQDLVHGSAQHTAA